MSPKDDDEKPDLISEADARMTVEERAKWNAELEALLWHGEDDFFQKLDRRIATVARTNEESWPDVYESNRFQDASDYVKARILTPAGFRNVMEKYATYIATKPASPLSKSGYVMNRVNLILAEWRSNRIDRPVGKEVRDEHIGSTAVVREAAQEFPLQELSLRIDYLSLQHRATLLLRLWPLQCFPESWRVRYLPIIQEAGVKNGLTKAETTERLEVVMKQRHPVSEDGLLEVETRRGFHFAKERHFDHQKRFRFAHLRRLEESGQYTPQSGVESLAKFDCYEAVRKSAEASVRAMFDSEDVYKRSASGIRKVNNPLWFRRSFCHCCYKQKYHRRIWLNARLELLNMKTENGPMSHAEIGRVLNCPENTSYSNLNRAIKGLLESGSNDAFNQYSLDQCDPNELKNQKEELKRESQDSQLEAIVCEDIQPSAG